MLRGEPFVTLGGEGFATTTTAAGVFHAIAGAAQEEAATEIHEAVVTVPANATGAARFRTREAAPAAAPTDAVDTARPVTGTAPDTPQPPSATGSTAIGAFTYSAGGLTIKIPAGCFLTHAVSGKGTKIAGKTCAQLWANGERKAVQCHSITK